LLDHLDAERLAENTLVIYTSDQGFYLGEHGWRQVRPPYGIRTDRPKLIHFTGDMDHWELFDLEEDPRELGDDS
jgi:arylsulfatase A-like enzyme